MQDQSFVVLRQAHDKHSEFPAPSLSFRTTSKTQGVLKCNLLNKIHELNNTELHSLVSRVHPPPQKKKT